MLNVNVDEDLPFESALSLMSHFFLFTARCQKIIFQRTKMIILTWSRKYPNCQPSFVFFPLLLWNNRVSFIVETSVDVLYASFCFYWADLLIVLTVAERCIKSVFATMSTFGHMGKLNFAVLISSEVLLNPYLAKASLIPLLSDLSYHSSVVVIVSDSRSNGYYDNDSAFI